MKKKLTTGVVALATIMALWGCSNSDETALKRPDSMVNNPYLDIPNQRNKMVESQRAEYAGFAWRLEQEPEDELPLNFRTCRDTFKPFDYNKQTLKLDPSFTPSRKGLDELNISGSSDFSDRQLTQLANELRKFGKPIIIVDLRSETHGSVNGAHISWFGKYNWGNIGLSTEEVLERERQMLKSLPGTTIQWGPDEDEQIKDGITVEVATAITEAEQCEAEGLGYRRFAILDHTFPADRELDEFINFVRDLPTDTWLHFHCQAGMGRTTILMALYDMMRNPDLPLRDIVYRHCLLGGNYIVYDGADITPNGKDGWKKEFYAEKAALMPVLWDYVQANVATGFKRSFSEWKRSFGTE